MAGFHHYKDKIVTLLPNKKVKEQNEDKEQKDSMRKQLQRHRMLIFYRFVIFAKCNIGFVFYGKTDR